MADPTKDAVLDALKTVVDEPVLMMSGVSREGLNAVLRALRSAIEKDRAVEVEENTPWQP